MQMPKASGLPDKVTDLSVQPGRFSEGIVIVAPDAWNIRQEECKIKHGMKHNLLGTQKIYNSPKYTNIFYSRYETVRFINHQ